MAREVQHPAPNERVNKSLSLCHLRVPPHLKYEIVGLSGEVRVVGLSGGVDAKGQGEGQGEGGDQGRERGWGRSRTAPFEVIFARSSA